MRVFKRVMAWSVLALMAISVVGLIVGALVTRSEPGPPIGRLSEPAVALPDGVPRPVLVDATIDFGFDEPVGPDFVSPMAGGAAAADLDGDGRVDLAVAHGDLTVMRSVPGGLDSRFELPIHDALSVTAADVDLDGYPDLLVARSGSHDTIFWGGDWLERRTEPDSTDLAGAGPSSQLLASDLDGDNDIDIVRLGGSRGPSDVLWLASNVDPRSFERVALAGGDRLSLTGEIADVDGDGLVDIWIGRDVGWDIGPDAVFSRRGVPSGEWSDVASEIGADLRIDSMGITLADLDGSGSLDAYVSDIGDNEVLLSGAGGFSSAGSIGAARIRPIGAPASVVSSSWASGATDLNLDGVLDLVVVNGGFPDGGERNKIPATSIAVDDPPAVLIGRGDGGFTDVWGDLGLAWEGAGRGMTLLDIDGDGDDDIVTVDVAGAVKVFRNDSVGDSVSVSLTSPCDSAGWVVTVAGAAHSFTRLMAPHTFGGSHAPVAIVGTDNGEVKVTVSDPAGRSESQQVAGHGRGSVSLPCPASG